METSQQLFGDSFSYGWLINIKPPFESLNSSFRHSFDGSSFIEMDPDLFSMRWTNDAHDFDFNLPSSQSPVLVHADQIFSNGLLQPLHLNNQPQSEVGYESFGSNFSRSKSVDSSKALLSRSNRFQSRYFYTVQSRPVSSNSSSLFHSAESTPISMSSSSSKSVASRSGKFRSPFFRNCTKSPKKILWKYLSFVMPLYKKVRDLSLTSPKSMRSCRDSVGNSPKMTTALSSIEWCRGNADSSIYDAILHCKKSIGQAS
ncbi:probable membrane-associated kinase regulator 6 [Elaeis guineensis]|uniref:Probable membrane-associated kinase regulator 6 n=1 Tax=Elaeis guineensis var. tenera TaxID=51953 RepID=A0A6I9R3Q7_ELAGV|nr:probable membrane-associated kinase regulator 6 [Elaeis guineensis]